MGYAIVIETRRLTLEPWTPSLASEFVALMAHPDVVRFGYGRPPTPGAALSRLSDIVLEWESNGFGAYAIRDRATGVVGGYTGVHVPTTLPDIFPLLEVGVRVIPQWWGKGFAFEAIAPVMDIGFDVLNSPGLAGIFLPANKGARDMNALLGMTFHSRARHPKTGILLEVHSVSKEAWIEIKKAHGLLPSERLVADA